MKATREDNSSVLFIFHAYAGETTPNKYKIIGIFWIIYNYYGI